MLSFIEAGDSRSPTRPRVYIGIKVDFFPLFRFQLFLTLVYSSSSHGLMLGSTGWLGSFSSGLFPVIWLHPLKTFFIWTSEHSHWDPSTETAFLFFSGLPFPRLHMRVPWTHLGVWWQSEFLYWPYTLDLTRSAETIFNSNQIRFFLELPLSSFI